MGLDAEFTVILREIVQFLECLREAKLSSALETVRENLLLRSKTALSVFTMTDGTTSTAEPYLHMNASSKGLLPLQMGETKELDSPEYVGAEETVKTEDQKRPASQTHPDHYETFLSVVAEDEKKKELEESQEHALVEIYLGLSGAQAKSKSLKCGPLYRKEGKKLFVFEQYRISWVALVGSHLLIYGSERDSKPYIVQGIRGYSGRPAPNAVARDQRRSEAAFEIFKPGNKTLQFIARTPKDMEQWVAKICQIDSHERTALDHGSKSKENSCPAVAIIETEEITPKDRLADSKLQTNLANVNEIKTVESDQDRKVPVADSKSPPPLPARIPIVLPRGLPSLPRTETISSYETMDDEEDDIYHRIEDFGNNTCYQNLVMRNQREKSKKAVAYDDVQAILKKERKNVNAISREEDVSIAIKNERSVSLDETYDDIVGASVMREKKDREVARSEDVNDACESQPSTLTSVVSYDDVETLVNTTSLGNKVKDKEDEVQKKLPNKKSFLNRMRNRKESPQKREKLIAARRETLTPPQTVQTGEAITYDDVSDLMIAKRASLPEETSEYNCPPTPRPVYAKSPTVILPVEEAVYDDVNGCHRKKDKQLKQPVQSNVQNLEKRISDDNEHYKSPRSDIWQHAIQPYEEEQLYDDVAILANFTARRMNDLTSDESRNQNTNKPSSSPDKKSWNRFVSNKKSKSNDSTSSGSNKRASSEITDLDISEEQPNFSRKNTFQKLINKMENSLGKVSPRSASMTSRTNLMD